MTFSNNEPVFTRESLCGQVMPGVFHLICASHCDAETSCACYEIYLNDIQSFHC